MTKILRFPCDCRDNYEKHTPRVSHSYRDSRQGLVQARTLARCSRKLQKIWRTAFSPPVLHLIIKFISDPPNRKYKLWFIRIRFNLLSQFSNKCHDITVI